MLALRADHPEHPDRVRVLNDRLRKAGLLDRCIQLPSKLVSQCRRTHMDRPSTDKHSSAAECAPLSVPSIACAAAWGLPCHACDCLPSQATDEELRTSHSQDHIDKARTQLLPLSTHAGSLDALSRRPLGCRRTHPHRTRT